jgi:hypothetical protein
MDVKLLGLRTDCPMTNPDTNKLFVPMGQCLPDFKHWEAMSKHHSPLTKKVVHNLLEFCKDFAKDSKDKAFAD